MHEMESITGSLFKNECLQVVHGKQAAVAPKQEEPKQKPMQEVVLEASE
jgi:hypothetical protein